MLSSCLSLWQSHIVKCTWGPHWQGRHLKLPARKGWKSPQCACQQVCLEAQHNGTLVPLLHRDTVEILPGPLHPGSQPTIRVVFVALPITKKERSSPCYPPETGGQGGKALTEVTFPSCFSFLDIPSCPSLAKCLQVEGKVTSATAQMAAELIAV